MPSTFFARCATLLFQSQILTPAWKSRLVRQEIRSVIYIAYISNMILVGGYFEHQCRIRIRISDTHAATFPRLPRHANPTVFQWRANIDRSGKIIRTDKILEPTSIRDTLE